MKKTVLAILSVAVLAAPCFAKQGAQLVLTTKDGQVISGELLAVKHHSLILQDSSGVGLTHDIDDLAMISVRKGSHLLVGLGIGLAAGTVLGAGIGYAAGNDEILKDPTVVFFPFLAGKSKVGSALIGGVLGAVGGTIVGAIAGLAAGAQQTIDLKKEPPDHIEKIIVWLRSKARYPEESY